MPTKAPTIYPITDGPNVDRLADSLKRAYSGDWQPVIFHFGGMKAFAKVLGMRWTENAHELLVDLDLYDPMDGSHRITRKEERRARERLSTEYANAIAFRYDVRRRRGKLMYSPLNHALHLPDAGFVMAPTHESVFHRLADGEGTY